MTTYLDTSVVVSLFAADVHSPAAERLVASASGVIVSDLTATEFASALAIQHRSGSRSRAEVRSAFATFDDWCDVHAHTEDVISADLRSADAAIRRLDIPLKAADTIHIMVAIRLGATLATFDAAMAREADRLGVLIAS